MLYTTLHCLTYLGSEALLNVWSEREQSHMIYVTISIELQAAYESRLFVNCTCLHVLKNNITCVIVNIEIGGDLNDVPGARLPIIRQIHVILIKVTTPNLIFVRVCLH
jgi:archaellum biogenesis protein FlaJ (TadC family)